MQSANLGIAWAVVNSCVVIKKLCLGVGGFIWWFFTVVMGLVFYSFFVFGERRGAHLCCTSRTQAKSTSKGGLWDGCCEQACAPLCSGQELRVLAWKITKIPSQPFRLRVGTWHTRMWCDSQDYSMLMLLKSINPFLDHTSSCWLLFYSIWKFF